jgi:heme-degrading monooxygenase HmoA
LEVDNVDRLVSEKGDGGVFARITKFEGSPERLDDLRYAVVERAMPAVRRLDGFAGALVLADRQNGNVQVVVLWESEEAMSASEDSAYWFRTYSAETAGERITGVERYEVIFSEVVKGPQ